MPWLIGKEPALIRQVKWVRLPYTVLFPLGWWNGRHTELKPPRRKCFEGSNPSLGTISSVV